MIYRFLFFFLLFSAASFAQTDSIVKDLDLRIMQPRLDRELSSSIRPKLERKVISIFTQNDVANRKGSTFAVYPMLSIIEFGKLEGIRTDQTVQLELSLLVKNVFSNQDFTVYNRRLSGHGKTKKAAINRAINSIRPQTHAYKKFIKETQEKIAVYFDEECETIIADAQKAMQNNEYQKAVAMLHVLPEQSECKISNQGILDQAYNSYQAQNCQALIKSAEVSILKKNFKDAINTLGQVDVNSPCKEDAKRLLQSVTEKVDEQTSKKMAFLNKVYKDNVDIQKARQQSMRSISNTYIEGIKKD